MFTKAMADPILPIGAGALVGLSGGAVALSAGVPGIGIAVTAAMAASAAAGIMAGRRNPAKPAAEMQAPHRDEAAALSHAAIETAPAAMAILDADGHVRQANAAFHAFISRHAPALRAQSPRLGEGLSVGADIRILLPDFDRYIASALPSELLMPAGDLCFGLSISSLPEGAGATVILTDRSAEARPKAQLAAIERNKFVLELAEDGRILRANGIAARTLGLDPETVTGRNLASLMTDDANGLVLLLAQAARSGFARARLHRTTTTGPGAWQDCAFHAIQDAAGRLAYVLCVGHDITESVLATEQTERLRHEAEEAQALTSRHLGEALTALAQGDLTHRIETAFPAQYERLRQNYNLALDKLTEALAEVAGVTGSIRNGAAEMNAAAEDLSRRTEGQAATLEQTAAALDELTASVRSAAESAASADRSARAAHHEAEVSGRVVTNAVEAMGQIEASSRQISQIIGVIDEIAFQTNLLALNAGVEAARAGEAGRGFAVVASEVRALAQRSSEAAREIKDLISASSRQVENGVNLVGQAGETLQKIVAGVTNIAEQVSTLAQSAREQATGITEINAGVTMLDQVTQQNAAMVEESTAASHSLHRASETLAALMQRFHLAAPASQTRPAAPAIRDPKVTPLRQPESAPQPVARDRAALRAASQPGWEEF